MRKRCVCAVERGAGFPSDYIRAQEDTIIRGTHGVKDRSRLDPVDSGYPRPRFPDSGTQLEPEERGRRGQGRCDACFR